MKLTNNQIAALLEVKAGKIRLENAGSRGIRIHSDIVAPTVIGRLEKMGLIEWRKTALTPKAFLTDNGSEILKQHVVE